MHEATLATASHLWMMLVVEHRSVSEKPHEAAQPPGPLPAMARTGRVAEPIQRPAKLECSGDEEP